MGGLRLGQGARRRRPEPGRRPRCRPGGCRRPAAERRHRHGRGAVGADRERPAGVPRQDLGAAPAAAAGEIRRRRAAQDRLRADAQGRPADGDRRAGRRHRAPRARPGAARRHRLGQDLHHGQGDRGDPAAGADPGAQQDARRPALWRVQVVLPGERGRVFRLLLRLLPARGLRPAHRHLYREGILHQRADRPHAPLGDALAARTRRRHHRRLGVVHLRHRFGRDLYGDDLRAHGRRSHRPAPAPRRSGGAALQARRRRFSPRHLPRARRYRRPVPGPSGGPRLARGAVRRRDRIDHRVRSADRAEGRQSQAGQGLRQFALRHAAPDAGPGGEEHQGGAQAAPRRARPMPGACSRRSGWSSAAASTSR